MTNSQACNDSDLIDRYQGVLQRIRDAERTCHRDSGEVALLAVSKTRSADEIRALAGLGQTRFGENYLQEALDKITQLRTLKLSWHFIGRIQSNKTRPIAEHFDWVHSVASLKHATRLSEQRPADRQPLNICLQVNTSGEASKGGHEPEQLQELLPAYQALENLRVRGLMTIPAPLQPGDDPRRPFRQLRELRDRLRTPELPLETLSMGMSDDLEAAVCEGAGILRIGTAIFGPRQYNQVT
ncbi:MAG: YggS family pyridoxal phosphate-dependent enzyme [Candidatus Thiodiazotropha sp.]